MPHLPKSQATIGSLSFSALRAQCLHFAASSTSRSAWTHTENNKLFNKFIELGTRTTVCVLSRYLSHLFGLFLQFYHLISPRYRATVASHDYPDSTIEENNRKTNSFLLTQDCGKGSIICTLTRHRLHNIIGGARAVQKRMRARCAISRK